MPIRIWLAVAIALSAAASPLGAEGAASAPANGLVAFVSSTYKNEYTPADDFADPSAGIGVVSSDGTGRRVLTHSAPGVGQPDWSPDGRRIALAFGNSIALMNADGSDLRTIPQPPGSVDTFPTWSSDGRLAFVRRDAADGYRRLVVADGGGRHQRTILRSQALATGPVWSRDNRSIEVFWGAGTLSLWATVVNLATGRRVQRKLPPRCLAMPIPAPRGNAAACLGGRDLGPGLQQLWLLEGHRVHLIAAHSAGLSQPAWSGDGTRVAYAVGNRRIIVRTLATGRDRTFDVDLTDPPRSFPPQVSWSPDGRHIVVGESSGVSWRIVVLDTRSGTNRLLIEHGSDVNPRWSPDGQTLAYLHLTAPGDGELRVRSLSGTSRTVARHIVDPQDAWGYAWSPDSRALAFVSSAGELSTVDTDGTGLRMLAADAMSSPAWSPDGLTIAYATAEKTIGLVDADGSAPQLTPPPGLAMAPAWSPDGTSLFFVQTVDAHYGAASWSFSTRQSRLLEGQALNFHGAFSPDGSKIYVTSNTTDNGPYSNIYDLADAASDLPVYSGGLGAWSPDGASMAFERYGSVEIVPLPAPGATWAASVIIHGALDPSWQAAP